MKNPPELRIKCLNCHHEVKYSGGKDDILCPDCGYAYPVLAGRFPVFIFKPVPVLANAYLGYTKALAGCEFQIEKVETNGFRSEEAKATMVKTLQNHSELYESFREKIAPHLSLPALAHQGLKGQPTGMEYELRFNYLRKDWAPGKAEQEEQKMLEGVLKGSFAQAADHTRALLLGAGMGRAGSIIAEGFEEVHTVDNSFTMSSLLADLIEGDITFRDRQHASVENGLDLGRELTASMPEEIRKMWDGPGKKIQHWLGDISQCHFMEESFSALYSIYFTDVLPLSKWLPRALALLPPGGDFIHFGPLSYHFQDESEHYSLDELKQILTDMGMGLVAEESMESSHCRSEVIGNYKMYRNWYLHFRKKEIKVNRLEPGERLVQACPITYRAQGEIPIGDTEDRYEIHYLNGKSTEISETILDIIRILEEPLTLEELFSKMESVYGELDEDSRDQVRKIVHQLWEKGVFKRTSG